MIINRNGSESIGSYLSASNYLSTFLLNGAAVDMAVDGSGAAVTYRYTVPANTRVFLTRSFLTIEDGAVAFTPGNFGAVAALANGVEVSVTPNGGAKVVLETWKTNREIRDTMFDLDQTFKTDGVYTGRWTFKNDLNQNGIVLVTGDVFDFKIQDDLSGLDYMSFKLKGIKQTLA